MGPQLLSAAYRLCFLRLITQSGVLYVCMPREACSFSRHWKKKCFKQKKTGSKTVCLSYGWVVSRWTPRYATSFPGSTPLSRWRLRAEKTLAHTVRPPAKYSTNRGVFFHVTLNRISSSLHLISGWRNQKWLKMSEDLASMWLHFACFSCKIGFFCGPLNSQIHLS